MDAGMEGVSLTGLAARRSFLVAAAAAAVVMLAGNPLARAFGLQHWAMAEDERKLTVLERSGGRPEVLLLGSSRVKFGLMATEIERRLSAELGRPVPVFNAAQASSGVVEASWILDEVAGTLGCPRAVVVDVNVEGLNAASGRLAQGLRGLLPPERWLAVLPHLTDQERIEAALAGLATGYGHLLYALQRPPGSASARREAGQILECRGSVYGPAGTVCRPNKEATLAELPPIHLRRQLRWYRIRLRNLHRLDRFRLGGLPEQGLERLAELCRSCASELVLVSLPTLYPWEEWGYGEAVAAAEDRAATFARRQGAPYLDAIALAGEPTLRDYHDPGHLSRRGAQRVSRRLAAVLVDRLRP